MTNTSDIPARDHPLTPAQPLSQSIIWEIQRAFFSQKGVAAWSENIVPYHISSNPFMARTYARLTKNFLRDCMQAQIINFAAPVTIVELGGGSGRLAYHFLHHLLPQLTHPPYTKLRLRFLLTDFSPEILQFWQEHPRFKPWVAAGILDFGLFNAEEPGPLNLVVSGERFAPGHSANPLLLIANYFFDSIPMDAFSIDQSRLHAYLLTIYSSRPEPDLADPEIWDRLEWEYEAQPITLPHYGRPALDDILSTYAVNLPDTIFLFPNVGLECLQYWQTFTPGPLLVLTADKGYAAVEGLVSAEDPLPGLHGSFSFMVNYHAINQFVLQQEGLIMQPAHYQDNLHVLAYLLGPRPNEAMETRAAFVEAVEKGGPDDFFGLKLALEEDWSRLKLPQLLNILRLSGYDSQIFQDLFPALRQAALAADPVWHDDLLWTLHQVWAGFFAVGDGTAVARQIRLLCQEIALPEDCGWLDDPVLQAHH